MEFTLRALCRRHNGWVLSAPTFQKSKLGLREVPDSVLFLSVSGCVCETFIANEWHRSVCRCVVDISVCTQGSGGCGELPGVRATWLAEAVTDGQSLAGSAEGGHADVPPATCQSPALVVFFYM